MRLFVKCWVLLLSLDLSMRLLGYGKWCAVIRKTRVARSSSACRTEDVLSALDLACVFYFKRVFCLQRSAAAVLLLRRHGTAASLVVGAQFFPFAAHAWVEASGTILNEQKYVVERYHVLDRY